MSGEAGERQARGMGRGSTASENAAEGGGGAGVQTIHTAMSLEVGGGCCHCDTHTAYFIACPDDGE